MKTEVTWASCPSEATILGAKIEEDAENHQFFFPCHGGPVAYQLTLAGDFLDRVQGLAACRCGALLGTLDGAIDGSKIKYWRALN